jgi:endonuclease/exonuclease/phosphatase family metal-dependent hydrolase
MLDHIRIATWNLDHASTSSRPIDLQIAQIRKISPDILILTETCKEVGLSAHGFTGIHSQENSHGKYCSAIHFTNRFTLVETLPTYEPETAVCVRLDGPLGEILVYATIITWRDDKGPDNNSPAWAEHYKAVTQQGDDWERLRHGGSGNIRLVVAGDFNQTRDGSKQTYGTRRGREMLGRELARNDLDCLTTENFGETGKLAIDPAKGWARSNIDHICVTAGVFSVLQVGAWDHFIDSRTYLSDHNGVYVDLRPAL